MSYNAQPLSNYDTYGAAPALYDVAAAQYLYGANLKTHSDDDIYQLSKTETAFTKVIWDGAGFDTLDASAQMLGATIDLNRGRSVPSAPMAAMVPREQCVDRVWCQHRERRMAASGPIRSPAMGWLIIFPVGPATISYMAAPAMTCLMAGRAAMSWMEGRDRIPPSGWGRAVPTTFP